MPHEAEKWSNLERLAATITDGDGPDEGEAWTSFWTILQPMLERWVRSPGFLGRVSAREDYCRDIVMLTWEKLQDNDYNKLRAYFRRQEQSKSSRPGKRGAFNAWMFRVFKNIGIDYMRRLPEYVRRVPGKKPSDGSASDSSRQAKSDEHWRAMVTLHSTEKPIHKTYTSSATARQLLEFLDESVSQRQSQAARLYEKGKSYADIASDIGLANRRDAERVVRRSLDRLKYRRAIELWSQNYKNEEIARELGLEGPEHAHRIINAAKELLKRHFR